MLVQSEGAESGFDNLLLHQGLRIGGAPSWRRIQSLALAIAVGDIGVLLVAYLATALRIESYTFDLQIPDVGRMLVWCAALACLWVPVSINAGAYGRTVIGHSLRSPYVIAKSTLIAGALFHVIPLVGGPVYSRSASMTVVLALTATMIAWRWLLSQLLQVRRASPSEIVVVGSGWGARALADAIASHPAAGVRIHAFVDTDPQQIGTTIHGAVVYPIADLPRLVNQLRDGPRVVLAIPEDAHASVYEQLTALAQLGVDVSTMPSVYEQVTGRIPVRHLGSFWWAMLPKPSSDLVYLALKRLVDICLSLLGLILLGLLLPVIGPLLRLETRGSLFFTQVRVGRFGQTLQISKLRTLPVDQATYPSYWARKRSNNPSPLAAAVRTIGVDELPQCWNVLRGQMSIVGPRPYVPEEVADYQHDIPFFRCRALVKPGLTGWAQVNWGYGLSLEDEIEKLQYDLYYVGHQSFYLDLLIIVRTVAYALRRARPMITAQVATRSASIAAVSEALPTTARVPPQRS